MWERKGDRALCGECWQSVNSTAVRDLAIREHGNLQELIKYMGYRGIHFGGEDCEKNLLFYETLVACSKLSPENLCQLHDTPEKPLIFNRYPHEPMDIPECGYTFEKSASLRLKSCSI